MPLVTCDISISIDGFAAGPDQSLEHPLGRIDENVLHAWMFERRDENLAEVEAIVDAGAFIMGRNMFGPDRGECLFDRGQIARAVIDQGDRAHSSPFVLGSIRASRLSRSQATRSARANALNTASIL